MNNNFNHIEPLRVVTGELRSEPGDHFGCFILKNHLMKVFCIVDDGAESGWEHVSVSTHEMVHGVSVPRIPSWKVKYTSLNHSLTKPLS